MAVTLLIAACGRGERAPPYTFSPAQVQILKESGSRSVRLGTFSPAAQAGEMTDIRLRAVLVSSPYGDYPAYLKEALRQDLEEAGRLAPNAATEISGVMTRNEMNTGVAVAGEGEIAARITVRRGDTTLYDKPIAAKTTWDSSFAGAVAIPNGIAQYPRLVSEFIATLLSDRDFLTAIK
jgi:hypothetical protein